MDHTASGQASWLEMVNTDCQYKKPYLITLLAGVSKRVLPQFFKKYQLKTQMSKKLQKHPLHSNIPKYFIGLKNLGR